MFSRAVRCPVRRRLATASGRAASVVAATRARSSASSGRTGPSSLMAGYGSPKDVDLGGRVVG